jgi:glutathione S-transferase
VQWIDSSAITRYVDEAFAGPALQPREPHADAQNSVMATISIGIPSAIGHLGHRQA